MAKSSLMNAVQALLARPAPGDSDWCAALRCAVDALERPFATYDRERFGGPTSRDRLITATRERCPSIWAEDTTRQSPAAPRPTRQARPRGV